MKKKIPEIIEESIDFLLNHPHVKIGKITNPIKSIECKKCPHYNLHISEEPCSSCMTEKVSSKER